MYIDIYKSETNKINTKGIYIGKKVSAVHGPFFSGEVLN